MLFGHNTNVTLEGTVFHVQTEDRGVNSATLDTTVHCRGRVLHRRTNKYHDLLPLDAEKEKSLKVAPRRAAFRRRRRVEVRRAESGSATGASSASDSAGSVSFGCVFGTCGIESRDCAGELRKRSTVEMLNPRTWLNGKHATLYLVVRSKDGGTPVARSASCGERRRRCGTNCCGGRVER